MKKFGIIPPKDRDTIIRTLELVCNGFPEGIINTLEIGVHRGETSRGIHAVLSEDKNRINFHTAIDNEHDLPIECPFPGCNLILGTSIHVSDHIKDESQHFIFCDANHSLFFTTADFLIYRNKVRIGGFFAFHDTSPHIKDFKDFQYVGDKGNPYNYIRCREAVDLLGLLQGKFPGWILVFDEYDKTQETGGMVVVKRIAR